MKYISPSYYYTIVRNFFQFIARPKLEWRNEEEYTSMQLPRQSSKAEQLANQQTLEPKVKDKIISSVFLLMIKFAFSISVASLIGLFYEPQNLTDQAMSVRFQPFVYLAVGGMILPFFEEILFRLSIVFKPIFLSLSLAAGTYYILTKVVFGSKLSLVDDTFLIRVGIALAIGLVSFVILQKDSLSTQLEEFWKAHFRWIYYSSAIIFAWLHVFNFEPTLTNLLLTPILTLPQLFSGLISGYLRVRFGFIYPLLLHICTNSLLIGLSILVE